MNGYRLRLYPTPGQQQILLRGIGCQRLTGNAKVPEDRYFLRVQQRMVGTAGMPLPVDQQYSRFITDPAAFLKPVPSQILRNGAVRFCRASQRCLKKRGRRPQFKEKSGRQSVWLTTELFPFLPHRDSETGRGHGDDLHMGHKKFSIGRMPDAAHREHAVLASIDSVVEGGQWRLSFAAADPAVAMPGKTVPTAPERVTEDLRPFAGEQLAERRPGGDRGVAQSLVTSDNQFFDVQPIQKGSIEKYRRQRRRWLRRSAPREKRSKNQKKAYGKTTRYHEDEKNIRHEYAHQPIHRLVDRDGYDLLVFEDLKIATMTTPPKIQRDAPCRLLPNGRPAKAGLNRAILALVWGDVVSFTRYQSLREGKLVITVPPTIVRRKALAVHAPPRTIGRAKPSLSVNAADTEIMRITMPPE